MHAREGFSCLRNGWLGRRRLNLFRAMCGSGLLELRRAALDTLSVLVRLSCLGGLGHRLLWLLSVQLVRAHFASTGRLATLCFGPSLSCRGWGICGDGHLVVRHLLNHPGGGRIKLCQMSPSGLHTHTHTTTRHGASGHFAQTCKSLVGIDGVGCSLAR